MGNSIPKNPFSALSPAEQARLIGLERRNINLGVAEGDENGDPIMQESAPKVNGHNRAALVKLSSRISLDDEPSQDDRKDENPPDFQLHEDPTHISNYLLQFLEKYGLLDGNNSNPIEIRKAK